MSSEILRRAATLMRERAVDATPGPWKAWQQHGRDYTDEGWSQVGVKSQTRDVALTYPTGFDHDCHEDDAAHIASWHPAVALAVADWLDAVAEVHWPKRHDHYSESHYNAEPEHEDFTHCDETCWTEAYICNGCGTATCRPEVSDRALAVARAYLGEPA